MANVAGHAAAMDDNPYLLNQNENPAMVIVSVVLANSGENYHPWSQSMVMALEMKNKLGFVDGTLPKPAVGDPLLRSWTRCNTTVKAWILHALDPQIAESVLWMPSALDIWNDLKRRYCHADVFRIADLQEEVYSTRQGDLSITAYFTKLRSLWEELDNLRPIPKCTCAVPCTCQLLPTIRNYRTNDFVIRFLKGLNEQYTAVRSQIMLMNPLPDMSGAFSLLIQQERQLVVPVDDDKFASNVTGRGRGRGQNGGKGNNAGKKEKLCTYCHRTNHTVDYCYRKYGFPPNFNPPKRSNVNCAVEDDDPDGDNRSVVSQRDGESHLNNIKLS